MDLPKASIFTKAVALRDRLARAPRLFERHPRLRVSGRTDLNEARSMAVDPAEPIVRDKSQRDEAPRRGRSPRLRIGLFLERSPDVGGGFQQALSTVVALARPAATEHDIVVFTQYGRTREVLATHGIKAIQFRHSGLRLLDKWSATFLGGAILRRLRRLGFPRLGRHLDALLDDHAIDIAILSECTEIGLRIGDHPFIVTVWDVFHRDWPEFPDVYKDRLFERWERTRRAMVTRAIAVIANSPSGARRLSSLYGVDPHRIVELPLLPSLGVRRHAAGRGRTTTEEVRRKYGLPARYVFYPAHFGALKNHLYLLEGLVALEQRHGIALDAVFCGSDAGNLVMVQRQARALGLSARVWFLGTVPDEDVPALYEGALALVMPAYSGPTNLPPLEAVTLGCPVVYSDQPEFREQMRDAAVYCDLADVSTLANHLAALICDSRLVGEQRAAGRQLSAEIAAIDYGQRLKPVLDDYAYLRRRWAWPQDLIDKR
jgi:glycosyltransferase involved in cell wall biosynthesis